MAESDCALPVFDSSQFDDVSLAMRASHMVCRPQRFAARLQAIDRSVVHQAFGAGGAAAGWREGK